jgi:hypothetical protein
MAMTLTHVAAAVAGVAIIASQFMAGPGAVWRRWAAAIGLAVLAAAIIHAVAS